MFMSLFFNRSFLGGVVDHLGVPDARILSQFRYVILFRYPVYLFSDMKQQMIFIFIPTWGRVDRKNCAKYFLHNDIKNVTRSNEINLL